MSLGSQPLVSVIVPAYNRAHTVKETVDSILNQTYRNLEIIVIDDGSKDNTQDVLHAYGERIRNIRQENAGQMVARNRGIKEAKGDIIAFLDSDDIWLPTCVERHVKILQEAPESVPCSLANGWLHFADGRKITSFQNSHMYPAFDEGLCSNMPEILATRFVMFCQFVAVRREALEEASGFDEGLKYMEDYDLPLKLSLLGPWAYISEPLVEWRQGGADTVSVSQRALKEETAMLDSLRTIRRRHLKAIQGVQKYKVAEKNQLRELEWDCLELRAAQLRAQGRTVLGKLLFQSVRYRKALFRRSPLFPKMKVEPIKPQGKA